MWLLLKAAFLISFLGQMQVFAVTKKAVAVLKGTAGVEGVVNLTQEDDGKESSSTNRS